MKRALIVASVGILASTVWVVSANAQADINRNVYPGNTSERYGARPAYAPAPAYGPSRRYARRAYRRSARQTYGAQTYRGAPPESMPVARPSPLALVGSPMPLLLEHMPHNLPNRMNGTAQ